MTGLRRVNASTWVGLGAWLAVGIVTAFVMREHGFGGVAQLKWFAVQAVAIMLPGWTLSLWASRAPWFARLAAAFVVGIPVQLLGWLVGVTAGSPALMWLVPVMVALVAGLVQRAPLVDELRGARPATPGWASATLAVLWVTVLGKFASAWAQNPAGDMATRWYQDMYWHLSINASAMYRVPWQDPQAVGETLQYHWVTNAFLGAMARAAGIDLVSLTAVAWAVTPFAAVMGLAMGVAHHLSRNAWVGVLAVALVAFPPSFALDSAISGGTTTNFLLVSPSHMMGLPIVMGIVWLLVALIREPSMAPRVGVPLAALILVSPGVKISLLPVVFCGLAMAFAVSLITRRQRVLLGALTAVVLAVIGGTYSTFGGGGGGSSIDLFGGLQARPFYQASQEYLDDQGAIVVLLILGGVVVLTLLNHLWAVVGFAAFRWRDPVAWLLLGTIASAVGVTLVLLHPGQSQIYFALGIQPVAAVVGAVGLGRLIHEIVQRSGSLSAMRLLAPVAALALVVGSWQLGVSRIESLTLATVFGQLAVLALVVIGLFVTVRLCGTRPALAVAGVAIVAFSVGHQVWRGADAQAYRFFSGNEVAARFDAATPPRHEVDPAELAGVRALADMTPEEAIVATNVHCRNVLSEPNCDARAFWVAGLGQRQVLLGGWAYTTIGRSTHMVDGRSYVFQPYPDQGLYRANETAFTSPSTDAMHELRELGVTHLFADRRAGEVSPDLVDVCAVVYSNETVTVCRLT